MGSERDRVIAEAGFRRGYEACTETFAGDGECNECGCGQDRFYEWDPAYRSKPEQVAVIDAIIAAVDAQHPAPAPATMSAEEEAGIRAAHKVGQFYNNDTIGALLSELDAARAQHPAPALPREVAMRIAEDVLACCLGNDDGADPPHKGDLDAIVSRHLPTDEEREAERAVVEAALAMRAAWTESPISAYDRKRDTMHVMADRLLAIRAKRGAR